MQYSWGEFMQALRQIRPHPRGESGGSELQAAHKPPLTYPHLIHNGWRLEG